MDLGTVRVGRLFTPLFLSYLLVVSIIISLFQTQLESGHYETPQDFAEDMRLVWYNALLYNPKGSDIHELTKEMQETFERAYEPIYRDWEKNARVHEERQRRRREKDLQRKAKEKAAETGTEGGGGDGGGDQGGTKDAEGGATLPTPTTATTTTNPTDCPMEGAQYRQEEINAAVPLEYAAGEQLTTAASIPIPLLAPTMVETPQLEGNNQGDAAVVVATAVDSSIGESVGGGVAVEMDVEQHPTTKEMGGEKEERQEAESMQGTTMTTPATTTTDSMGIGESSNGASMPGLGPQGLLPAATEEPTQRPEQPQQPQQPGVPELTSTPPPTFLGT